VVIVVFARLNPARSEQGAALAEVAAPIAIVADASSRIG
jgi:hypothetical protein